MINKIYVQTLKYINKYMPYADTMFFVFQCNLHFRPSKLNRHCSNAGFLKMEIKFSSIKSMLMYFLSVQKTMWINLIIEWQFDMKTARALASLLSLTIDSASIKFVIQDALFIWCTIRERSVQYQHSILGGCILFRSVEQSRLCHTHFPLKCCYLDDWH